MCTFAEIDRTANGLTNHAVKAEAYYRRKSEHRHGEKAYE